jgi:hypothetical protein
MFKGPSLTPSTDELMGVITKVLDHTFAIRVYGTMVWDENIFIILGFITLRSYCKNSYVVQNNLNIQYLEISEKYI